MEIEIMERSDAPETWTLSPKFAILAYVDGADGAGWYLAWLTRDEDRRDVFFGDSDRDQALESAQNYLAANGLN